MPRTLTPLDGCAIMTQIVRQATGQDNYAAVNVSNFVSAGETVLATGMENTYNAVHIVLGRLVVAVRAYKGKFATIQAADTNAYAHRYRKISYYAQDPLESGYFNTDQNTNLAQGYTSGDNGGASTKSQWEQHQAMPLEMNFGGSTTWQDCITLYEEQVKMAFSGPDEFVRFVEGFLMEHGNDIESQKEAFRRMTVVSKMAAIYDYAVNEGVVTEAAVNLTAAFNAKYRTTYTTDQLKSTYLKEFSQFAISRIKTDSNRLTNRSTRYHNPMTKTVSGKNYHILRHTPKANQRLILYGPLITDIESTVMPEIFGPDYMSLGQNFETVDYWQTQDGTNDMGINYQTSLYDAATGAQKQGAAVALDNVVGILFDRDAIFTDFQLEIAHTTPVEARKGYRNTWLTFAKNAINDPTENAILYYMAD